LTFTYTQVFRAPIWFEFSRLETKTETEREANTDTSTEREANTDTETEREANTDTETEREMPEAMGLYHEATI
jgi:hypothetical protein